LAFEKLTTELEENLANPGMRTSHQEGKRRKEQTVTKTTSNRKRLNEVGSSDRMGGRGGKGGGNGDPELVI
jgi:hypothetical protein